MRRFSKELLYPELRRCNCVKQHEYIYFFAKNYNILCRISLNTNTIDVVGSLLNENFDAEHLIFNIVEYKNMLICIPNAAKDIHIIDLNFQKEVGQIMLRGSLCGNTYRNIYLENENCYLFPLIGNEFMQIDLSQSKIVKVLDIGKIYKKVFGENYTYFSGSDCYRFENKIYMVMFESATVVELDIYSLTFHFYKINGMSKHYVHVTGFEQRLYILGDDSKIYIWNILEHIVENIIQLGFNEGDSSRYGYSVNHKNYIYLFKYVPSDEFIRICIENSQAEVLSLKQIFKLDKAEKGLLNYMNSDGNKFFFMSKMHEIYIIDFRSREVEVLSLRLNEDEIYKCIEAQERDLSKIEAKTTLEGRYIWSLENYIRKYVIRLKDIAVSKDKNIGDIIFSAIKMDYKESL